MAKTKSRPNFSGAGDVPEYTADEMRAIWAAGVAYGEKHPNDADKEFDEEFTQAFAEAMVDIEVTVDEEQEGRSEPVQPGARFTVKSQGKNDPVSINSAGTVKVR
jgi:hypothetical protein